MVGSGKYQGAGRGSCASEQWGKRGEKTRRKDSADSGRPTPGRCRRKQVSLRRGRRGSPCPGGTCASGRAGAGAGTAAGAGPSCRRSPAVTTRSSLRPASSRTRMFGSNREEECFKKNILTITIK